jgi:hypothetical protein
VAKRFDPGSVPDAQWPPPGPAANRELLESVVRKVGTRYRVRLADMRLRVLWAGDAAAYKAMVLAVTLPSGGAAQVVHLYAGTGPDQSLIRLPPAAEVTSRAVGWAVRSNDDLGRIVMDRAGVYAPRFAGHRIELSDGAQTLATGVVQASGVALLPRFQPRQYRPGQDPPPNLTYRIIDSAGRVVYQDRVTTPDLPA